MATVRLSVDLTYPAFVGVPARGIRVAIPFIRDAGRFIPKASNEFGNNPGALLIPGNTPLCMNAVSFYCGGNVIVKKQVTEFIQAGVLRGAYISDTGIDAVDFASPQPADWNSPWLQRCLEQDVDGALTPTGDQDARFDFTPFEFVVFYPELAVGETCTIEPWGRNMNTGTWYIMGSSCVFTDRTVQIIETPANTEVFLKVTSSSAFPLTICAQGQTPKTTQ